MLNCRVQTKSWGEEGGRGQLEEELGLALSEKRQWDYLSGLRRACLPGLGPWWVYIAQVLGKRVETLGWGEFGPHAFTGSCCRYKPKPYTIN